MSGLVTTVQENLTYFRVFLNDAATDLIVTETNKYYHYVTNMFPFKDHSRVHKKIDTTPQQFYVFLVLMLLMPLISKHTISDYWKNDPLITTPISLCLGTDFTCSPDSCILLITITQAHKILFGKSETYSELFWDLSVIFFYTFKK